MSEHIYAFVFHKQVCDKVTKIFHSTHICLQCNVFLLDMCGGIMLAVTPRMVPGSGPGSIPVGDIFKYGCGLHIFIVIFYSVRDLHHSKYISSHLLKINSPDIWPSPVDICVSLP